MKDERFLHVVGADRRVSVENGLVTVDFPEDDREKFTIPAEDVLSLIVATPRFVMTGRAVSEIASGGGVVVHCGEKFEPVAVSRKIHENRNDDTVERQVGLSEDFEDVLWDETLSTMMAGREKLIGEKIETDDESEFARKYWSIFTEKVGVPSLSRKRGMSSGINGLLDYGSVVASTAVLREIVSCGLIPSLGIHHETGFGKNPLAYDLVEPVRPWIESWIADKVMKGRTEEEILETLPDALRIEAESGSTLLAETGRMVRSFAKAVREEDAEVYEPVSTPPVPEWNA